MSRVLLLRFEKGSRICPVCSMLQYRSIARLNVNVNRKLFSFSYSDIHIHSLFVTSERSQRRSLCVGAFVRRQRRRLRIRLLHARQGRRAMRQVGIQAQGQRREPVRVLVLARRRRRYAVLRCVRCCRVQRDDAVFEIVKFVLIGMHFVLFRVLLSATQW